MNRHSDIVVRLAIVAVLWMFAADSARFVHAEGPDERAPAFDYMRKSFAEYVMLGQADPKNEAKAKFTFQDKELYHWTVRIAGRTDGALFVWLDDGRPEVVGCVVTRPSKSIIYHEFHSLSENPVTATLQSQKIWHPATPGLQMEPVPDAPTPASNPRLRRSQMRKLARDFSASVVHQKDGTRWETRMLARPLCEYTDQDGGVLDGGLFLFVRGNDPQFLVVLEACRDEATDRWKYGVARLASHEITVKHNQRVVQIIDKWPWRFKPNSVRPRDEPYAQFMMGTYPVASDDEAE